MKAIFLIIKSRFKVKKVLVSLIILMFAASISLLNISLALSNGFESRFIGKIISFSPQINIFTTYKPDISDLENQFEKMLLIKQIQALAINHDNQAIQGVVLRGSSHSLLPKLIDTGNILRGKFPEKDEILVGNKLAENLGADIGDNIQVLVDPASFSSFRISGIFKVGLYDYDSTVILTNENNISNLARDSMLIDSNTFYGVWLKNPDKAKLIADEIQSRNLETNVSNWQDDNKTLINAIEMEKKVVFLVLTFLIVVASLGILMTQIIQILNQKTQIGILAAIGFTPEKVMLLYLLEGFTISISGIVLGLIFSVIMAKYLSYNPISLPINVYHIGNLPVNLKAKDMLEVSVFAILISAISSIIPAFYAAKLSPVQILRSN